MGVGSTQFEGYSVYTTATTSLSPTTSSSSVKMFFFDDSANVPNSSGGFTSTDISNVWDFYNDNEPLVLSISGDGYTAEYLLIDIYNRSSYYRLNVEFLSGSSTIPDDVDLAISFKQAPVSRPSTYESGTTFNVSTNSSGLPVATNILTADVPAITSYGTDVSSLVKAYRVTFNFNYKPWSSPDNSYQRVDVWCSKGGTNGWIKTSYHPFTVDLAPDNDDATYGISKTFFVDNSALNEGDSLQLNIAVKHYNSSGSNEQPGPDATAGAIYESNCMIEALTADELVNVTGGTITTSVGGGATGISPASTGVTRTQV